MSYDGVIIQNHQLVKPLEDYPKTQLVILCGAVVTPVEKVKLEASDVTIAGTGYGFRLPMVSVESGNFYECDAVLAQEMTIDEKAAIYRVILAHKHITMKQIRGVTQGSYDATKLLIDTLVAYGVLEKYHSYWRRSSNWTKWMDQQQRQRVTEVAESSLPKTPRQHTSVTLQTMLDEVE